MQLHIATEKDTVTVHADVTRIEVEDSVSPDADDPDAHAFRTIRFVGHAGDAIEVRCRASANKNGLRLRRVKLLKPVNKPTPCHWQVYTGDSSDESEEQESD
jgi:hypothetical protein